MHLSYLGPASWDLIFHILSSWLTVGSGGSHIVALGFFFFFFSGHPLCSEIHIWRAEIANVCELLVYCYGRKYSISQPPGVSRISHPPKLPVAEAKFSVVIAKKIRASFRCLVATRKAEIYPLEWQAENIGGLLILIPVYPWGNLLFCERQASRKNINSYYSHSPLYSRAEVLFQEKGPFFPTPALDKDSKIFPRGIGSP